MLGCEATSPPQTSTSTELTQLQAVTETHTQLTDERLVASRRVRRNRNATRWMKHAPPGVSGASALGLEP